MWSTPFERAGPVRSFPSFRGQASFTGLYYAATMEAYVGFESWLERDVAMMLDYDPAVVVFSSQPFWLHWAQDGGQRRHVPDYFARLADGMAVVIDVRPDDRIERRDAEAFAATERACREVGWLFRRTAGPGAVLAANVRWLAGYRHRRCYRGEVAGRLIRVFAEPKPLMGGAREAGDPVGVLPVLYHLLWKQVLSAEVTGGMLGPGSVVGVSQEGTGR
ncbi:MAG TPA: TnsA-like heteromeric transposase endonuclease subunit [Streptosporangiaceae bacterium]|nr:TnsA-like heteromeric transposase endonuclease subunit [Streptosporangiaceae bacterium]